MVKNTEDTIKEINNMGLVNTHIVMVKFSRVNSKIIFAMDRGILYFAETQLSLASGRVISL